MRRACVRDAPFSTVLASRALLLSQAVPFAARAFTVPPTRDEVTRPVAAAPAHALAARAAQMRGPWATRRAG